MQETYKKHRFYPWVGKISLEESMATVVLQHSCLENPTGRGARQATVHNVAKSQTGLKWLSMHVCKILVLFLIPIIHFNVTTYYPCSTGSKYSVNIVLMKYWRLLKLKKIKSVTIYLKIWLQYKKQIMINNNIS